MKNSSENLCSNCKKIKEINEQHRLFISHLSHEVRNPLTLISSSLQLLEKECPAVKDSVLWSQILEDVHSTVCLLQDISALNNAGKLSLTVFHAKEFLSALAISFSSFMKEHNIYFTVQLAESLSFVSLTADRQKLQEAITNLLINAADALCGTDTKHISANISFKSNTSCPSAIHSEILFSADLQDDMLCIHVKDNGPGIPDEYLETLFDPFVTHKSTGTGLGLSIVKSAATLHGGSITVETSTDTPDSYTDFCLRVPVTVK